MVGLVFMCCSVAIATCLASTGGRDWIQQTTRRNFSSISSSWRLKGGRDMTQSATLWYSPSLYLLDSLGGMS